MTSESSLYQRRRALSDMEFEGIPWLGLLLPAERQRAVAELVVSQAVPGDHICRAGRPVTYWFGVVDGLLKMSSDNAQGRP